MDYTIREVLQFVEENDVKFVRLAFFDVFGSMKNISIMSTELSRAFDYGISFDASSVKGFMNVEESDLLLYPDASTLAVLPWRPQQGRVVRFYCNIKHPDGTDFEGDGRSILKGAMQKALEAGYVPQIGTECEFYLFEADEKGNPTSIPHDNAGYCDIAPADKGENVRREICLTLEEMGIQPERSHHESGPGQNEIDFKYNNALIAADNLETFKAVVRSVAGRSGLFASFLPKPIKGATGSGLHVNFSLLRNGINIFKIDQTDFYKEAEFFIAGILKRASEITLFSNPIINSYARLGSGEAPRFITWSYQNRSQLVRIPAAAGDFSRMELRSPDPSCNPYIVFALLIYAGLEGIKEKIELQKPTNLNLYTAKDTELNALNKLPFTLEEAFIQAKNSEFVKENLPKSILDAFYNEKKKEWEEYSLSKDKDAFEKEKYFNKY